MTKEIRIQSFTPEIRAGEDGKQKIVGYAVKWNQRSKPIYGLYVEQFVRGAFSASLQERSEEIYASWQHDVNLTLGRSPNTLTLREDDTGLWYEIDPPSWASPQVESIQRGDVRGSSFIFDVYTRGVVEYDWDSDPNYVIRTVRKADLYEVSPVTLPAYPSSTAGIRGEDPVADMIRSERERRANAQRAFIERNKMLRDLSIQQRS